MSRASRMVRSAKPAIIAVAGFVVLIAAAGVYAENWPPAVIADPMSMMHRRNETNIA